MANFNQLWKSLTGNYVTEIMLRIPQLAWDIWATRILSKYEFGVWVGFRLMLQIIPYFRDVFLVGLDIRYSHIIGSGDRQKAREIAAIAGGATIAASLIICSMLFMGLFYEKYRWLITPGSNKMEFIIFIFIILLQGIYSFFVTHLRNQLLFSSVNFGILLGNIVSLCILFFVLPEYRVTGALAAFCIGMTISLVPWFRHLDIAKMNFENSLLEVRTLLKIGFALVVSGLAFDLLRVITRWSISQSIGLEALGNYGTAFIFAGAVFLAGTSSSRVIIQFVGRSRGANENKEEQIKLYLFYPGIAIAAVSAITGAVVWVGAHIFLPWWAPQQIGTLSILRPAIYGAFFLAISYLGVTILRGQEKIREIYMYSLIMICIQVALLILLSFLEADLWWYLLSEAATFCILMIFLIKAITSNCLQLRKQFAKYIFGIFVTSILGIEISAKLSGIFINLPPKQSVGLEIICILLFYSAWMWPIYSRLRSNEF